MLISKNVISKSNVIFGTSGARGLVTDFTPEVCAAFTVAFVNALRSKFHFERIAIAIDNRPSSYAMALSCAAAIKCLNLEFIYFDVIPTPALAFYCLQNKIPGIMVTGSHIPFDRNGLKFYRPDGEISKSDELEILNETCEFEITDDVLSFIPNNAAKVDYIERYTILFPNDFLAGKRIGIYEHSSAGRDIYKDIFAKLGAEVVSLGRSDNFVPIDTEAVSDEDQNKAIKWSQDYSLDSIFSTDGDGDRPLVSDENGIWLRGDILGLICADAMSISAIALPVSCNTAVELSGKFNKILRIQIGSPYVISAFNNLAGEFNSFAGFEANGGFILGSDVKFLNKEILALPTRDAVLPALMLLYSADTQPISDMINSLPQRFTYSNRIQDFPTSKSKLVLTEAIKNPQLFVDELGFKEFSVNEVNLTDGLRMTSDKGDVLHFRPSGNAPELRCYAEADSYFSAKDLVSQALSALLKI